MDKKILLAAASVAITGASIATAVFLWDRLPSPEERSSAPENALGYRQQQLEDPNGELTTQKDTAAVITDVEHSKEQPAPSETVGKETLENAVRVSLPDPNDATPDRSVEKFQSDEDEEDTDDGITIETEPDDE